MSAGLAAIGMTVGPSASYWWRPGYLAPLTLLGAFQPAPGLDRGYYLLLMAVAGVGVVLTTVYLVVLVRRVAQGTTSDRWRDAVLLRDATPLELAVWSPVVLLVATLGLWPGLLLDATDPVVRRVIGS